MIPIGPIVLAVALAVRAVNARSGNGPPAAVVPTSRGTTSVWSDPHLGGTVGLQFLLWLAFIPAVILSFDVNGGVAPVAVAVSLLLSVPLFPWWWTRNVFVPRGLPRLAYFASMLSRVTWRRDKPGGPLLAAAWALSRQRVPSAKLVAKYEARLEKQFDALHASSVVAKGLFAAMAGKRDEARRWMESVFLFDPRIAIRPVRRLATEWLLADASARGEWRRVVTLASSRQAPWSPMLALARLLARRQLGESVAPWRLWLGWVAAPRRLRTFRFVRQTARKEIAPKAAVEAPVAAASSADPLRAALSAQWAAVGATTPAKLLEAARTWEAVLADGSLRQRCTARVVDLGGVDSGAAADELGAAVRDFFTPHAQACREARPHEPLPEVLSAALSSRRDALFSELEERMDRLTTRKGQNRIYPMIEEWREVLALRSVYLELCAVSTFAERPLAHGIISNELVNYGAWLFNQHKEKPVANAIFRMLELEAVSVGDAKSAELNRENAACGL